MTTHKGSRLSRGLKRSALSVALGMCVAGGVQAQSTSGSIRGTVPAGTSITISNNSGFSRSATVDASGRYNFGSLPIGNYTVEAAGLGKRDAIVTLGNSTDVSFGDATTLGTVSVLGTSAPKVDVTTTSTSTVITSERLTRIPTTRSAEAIALLSPGAVAGDSQFGGNHGGAVSFGGASVGENAYYINGYLSNTPTNNVSGYSLPYGVLDQQETYTGGYSAKYGRSAGGVINQVGKSGTNDFHFGGYMTYTPRSLKSDPRNVYYPNEAFPEPYAYEDEELPGNLYRRGSAGESWNSTYFGYVSGPLIKDRLFAYVGGEFSKDHTNSSPVDGSIQRLHAKADDNNIYAKLNWNITDNNLLEYTYLHRKYTYEGIYHAYDFSTGEEGEKNGAGASPVTEKDDFSILKYTSFLSDDLTFNATYGRGRMSYNEVPFDAVTPNVGRANFQNPAYWPSGVDPSVGVDNTQSVIAGVNAEDKTYGLRAELEWVLGDHTLTFGMDNQKMNADNEGVDQVVDNYQYYRSTTPSAPINADLGVGAPGGTGYYVTKGIYSTATSMKLQQRAFYIEDRWQITDNVLLTVGLRDDKFANYNVANQPYVKSDDQWAPRIGASWDVFGDSSLKIFGNAGRYFLAIPNGAAIRGASAALYTTQYFTYTGINADGTPVLGTELSPGPVSSNNEFGQAKDPSTVAATNLKNMYQDEYILGFAKTLGDHWSYGAKFTFRDLKTAIDDICDPDTIIGKLEEKGVDLSTIADPYDTYCWLANPNESNTFAFAKLDGSGYETVDVDASDWGWPSQVKRQYKAVDLFIERAWDGKWEARIDYTYSKLQGNTEGPVNTDTGQGSDEHDSGTNLSQNWDLAQIMEYADGYLANDRRHSFKIYGSYAITPEWLVSANARIMSGTPISCFDYYDPDGSGATDPAGYYGSYHTCFGEPSPPGKKYTSWTHRYDLGLTYRPAALEGKLAVSLNVYNVLNERKGTAVDGAVIPSRGAPYGVSNTYNMPYSYTTPRYAMFSVSYDY